MRDARLAGMRWLAIPLALLCTQCTQPAAGNDDPPGSQERPRARYHMRQHFSDLRTVQQMLVAGKLEEAKAFAFLLTRSSPAMRATPEGRDVTLAAGSLASARTLDDAVDHAIRIGGACASCHVRVHKTPLFPVPSRAPRDAPTIAAQMARHEWAVARLWEGYIGASQAHWRAGLYVLATSPLPRMNIASSGIARTLQQRARRALDRGDAPTIAERAADYADLLDACVSCHAENGHGRAR